MPRKKIEPKPLEIIHCNDFDIELMEDGWNIVGHGSNKVKEFMSHVNKMLIRMIDDFVDNNGNLKPLLRDKNDYFRNASVFSKRAELYGLGEHLEDNQQLRKAYYPVVKKEIEINIKRKVGATPPPKSFALEELLEHFKS